jgi:hypothetical protein
LLAPLAAEFRRTKSTDNPIHIIGFLSQWKLYLDEVRGQVAREQGEGAKPFSGRPLNTEFFEKVRLGLPRLDSKSDVS